MSQGERVQAREFFAAYKKAKSIEELAGLLNYSVQGVRGRIKRMNQTLAEAGNTETVKMLPSAENGQRGRKAESAEDILKAMS